MPTTSGDPAVDRIPDPVALAQGHRLMRAATSLELPAWILGVVTLLMVGVITLLNEVEAVRGFGHHDSRVAEILVGALAVVGVTWLLARPRRPPVAARVIADASARLPRGLGDLLALIDGLIEQLERAEDRSFDLEAAELGVALARLTPAQRRFLEQRGADTRALDGVGGDAELVVEALSPERRRALHQRLVQFAAAARGRACGDPYRSRIGDGPRLLAAIRDPALGRTRRIHAVVMLAVGLGWGVAIAAIMSLHYDVMLCSRCDLDPDVPGSMLVITLAAAPSFALLAAALSRAAAWRSWAAALPAEPAGACWIAGVRARLRRSSLLVVSAPVGLAPAWVYAALGFDWVEVPFVDVAVVLGLAPLGLLVTRSLARALAWRLELDSHRRRVARAPERRRELLDDLFAYRLELGAAAPPRREPLEQLAALVRHAGELGVLEADEREHLLARLSAAARRGPALTRACRERLLVGLRGCERQIAEVSA